MSVFCDNFIISTKGFSDVIDITSKVQDIVLGANTENGLVNVISSSPTVALIILENVPETASDLVKLIETIAPINKIYQRDNFWHEGNAFSHLRAALLGNNITLPLCNKKLKLDENSQIILIDFDNKQTNRQITVTVTY